MVLEMACDSDSEDPGVSEDQAGQLDTTLSEAQMTLKQEMDCAIKQSLATHQSATLLGADKSLEAAIKTEMALFESSGVRGRSLQLVYGQNGPFLQQGRCAQRSVLAWVIGLSVLCAFSDKICVIPLPTVTLNTNSKWLPPKVCYVFGLRLTCKF